MKRFRTEVAGVVVLKHNISEKSWGMFFFFFLDWIWEVTMASRNERVEAVSTLSHMQSITVSLLLISVFPSTFLSLSIILSLSARPCSFHYTVQGTRVDIWVLHRGLGHKWLLDIHHTHHSYIHSLVKPMKGSFEKGCWADNAQLN